MSKDSQEGLEDAFDELDDALQEELEAVLDVYGDEDEDEEEVGIELPEDVDLPSEDEEEVVEQKKKPVVRMSASQKDLEILYAEFEKLKTEAKEKQDRAKEVKEEIINIMDTLGKDEVVINGLDSLVHLSITYPEKEVLNKKELAEELGIKQKELSKPQTIIELTNAGKITTEMIEKHTHIEENMQFSAKEYNPNAEED